MTTTYFTLKAGQPSEGYVDLEKIDSFTEEDLNRFKAEDEEEARQDAMAYLRNVRTKLNLSQTEFAKLLNVSVTSIRNWEQGKRFPTGAARSLYRILDRAPEAAIEALVENREFAA